MKNLLVFLFLLTGVSYSCKTTKPAAEVKQSGAKASAQVQTAVGQETNFSEPSTWLLGYLKTESLEQPPYSTWYIKGYDDYAINSDPLNKLLDIKSDNLKIKIVMGTWCPDSRRELPKFMRILNIWRFPVSQVIIIGVDKAKKADVSELKSLDIQKVPTFIIYKNNIEAGRIIENPVTSLEQDMVNILTRNE